MTMAMIEKQCLFKEKNYWQHCKYTAKQSVFFLKIGLAQLKSLTPEVWDQAWSVKRSPEKKRLSPVSHLFQPCSRPFVWLLARTWTPKYGLFCSRSKLQVNNAFFIIVYNVKRSNATWGQGQRISCLVVNLGVVLKKPFSTEKFGYI